jgi:hypothetical protein
MVSPVTRHSRRSQAEIPLIELSEFPRPPLPATKEAVKYLSRTDRQGRIHESEYAILRGIRFLTWYLFGCLLSNRHSWHDFVVGRLVVDEVHRRARVVGLSRRAVRLASWPAGRHRSPQRLLLCDGDGHPDRIGHVDRDDGDHSALILSRSTSRSTTALLRSASCAANSSVTASHGPGRTN